MLQIRIRLLFKSRIWIWIRSISTRICIIAIFHSRLCSQYGSGSKFLRSGFYSSIGSGNGSGQYQPRSASFVFSTLVSADPDPGIFSDLVFTQISDLDMDPVSINPDIFNSWSGFYSSIRIGYGSTRICYFNILHSRLCSQCGSRSRYFLRSGFYSNIRSGYGSGQYQPRSATFVFSTLVSADPDPDIFSDLVFTQVSDLDMDPVSINLDLHICYFTLRALQSVRNQIQVFSRIRFLLICQIWIWINPDLHLCYFALQALQSVRIWIRVFSRIRFLLIC